MAWRWRNSINLGGGARTTLTAGGVGVSWGFAGFRIGRSPTGSLWVSFTLPGTGLSFFKYLSPQDFLPAPQQRQSSVPLPPPGQPGATNLPPTPNHGVLDWREKT